MKFTDMPYFVRALSMKNKKTVAEDYAPVRSSVSEDSKEGLLHKERLDAYEKPRTFWSRNGRFILIQVALLALYTIAAFLMTSRASARCFQGQPLSHSPASDAIIWEERRFVLGDRIQEKGVYSGKPRPALDKAWHDLLNAENIRLEPEVMRRLGREDIGVRIPGEDGYIGTLNVYHELHCLKRIHQFMYEEQYYPGISAADHEMNRLHNEHCIDFLRQSAMCHGDVGLITFEWHPKQRIPIANATTHQCVKWDVLDHWTKERSVDMLKPGWLVHPTLGLAYPTGEGDNIGAATDTGHPGSGHGHN